MKKMKEEIKNLSRKSVKPIEGRTAAKAKLSSGGKDDPKKLKELLKQKDKEISNIKSEYSRLIPKDRASIVNELAQLKTQLKEKDAEIVNMNEEHKTILEDQERINEDLAELKQMMGDKTGKPKAATKKENEETKEPKEIGRASCRERVSSPV